MVEFIPRTDSLSTQGTQGRAEPLVDAEARLLRPVRLSAGEASRTMAQGCHPAGLEGGGVTKSEPSTSTSTYSARVSCDPAECTGRHPVLSTKQQPCPRGDANPAGSVTGQCPGESEEERPSPQLQDPAGHQFREPSHKSPQPLRLQTAMSLKLLDSVGAAGLAAFAAARRCWECSNWKAPPCQVSKVAPSQVWCCFWPWPEYSAVSQTPRGATLCAWASHRAGIPRGDIPGVKRRKCQARQG